MTCVQAYDSGHMGCTYHALLAASPGLRAASSGQARSHALRSMHAQLVLAPAGPSLPGARLAVDFVLRQDHLDEDLQQLMLHLNSRPGE